MAGPLKDADLATINTNLEQLLIADEQIKMAQQAGIDVADFKKQATDQRSQLLKIKQTYFPGQ